VIPKGVILLRMIPTAVHTDADIEQTLNAFSAVSEKLKAGAYKDEVLNPVLG
jgi:glycine C-acetyltransferase